MLVEKYTRGLILSLLLLQTLCSGSKVVVLDDATFEHQTQSSTGQTTGKWFVMFYATWCSHCERLHPTWDQLANDMDRDPENDVIVAKVEATENRAVSRRFGIRGFPILLYFADRKMYPYKGERGIEALTEFVKTGYKETKPQSVPPPPAWGEQIISNLRNTLESNEFINALSDDFNHILAIRKNAAVVLLLCGFMLGMAVCSLIFSFTFKASKRKAD